MVKIYCDRCGEEIKQDYYYTVYVRVTELNSKTEYSITDCANALSALTNNVEKSPYEKLNSQTMHCEKCKNDIENFIYGDDNLPFV